MKSGSSQSLSKDYIRLELPALRFCPASSAMGLSNDMLCVIAIG
jgi:hypothetical protein